MSAPRSKKAAASSDPYAIHAGSHWTPLPSLKAKAWMAPSFDIPWLNEHGDLVELGGIDTGRCVFATPEGMSEEESEALLAEGKFVVVAAYPVMSPLRAPERTAFLADALGSSRLAGLLGVSKSQPTRWRKGEETPSPRTARELVDLDHIYARACLLWEPEVAKDWLESPNSHLDGATPLDVLRTRGAAEVLMALDAAEQGGMG